MTGQQLVAALAKRYGVIEVADWAGVNRTQVWRWANGLASPTADAREKLSEMGANAGLAKVGKGLWAKPKRPR